LKVVIVGGGPAGLYLALLLKKRDPRHHTTVLERNAPDSTFGWGVVFSDQTLENFRNADLETYQQITNNFAHWDDIDVHFKGRTITSGGHGFSGIARQKLLNILQNRAAELGVEIRFNTDLRDDADLANMGLGAADLIVAADGINSGIRRKYAQFFQPELDVRSAKYIWLGTDFKFDAFTFYFVDNEHGVFQAHCYRFDANTSTFIVECDPESWRKAGFDKMDGGQTIAACEQLFGKWLKGHKLMSNASHMAESPWMNFVRVGNAKWHHKNIVLIGDAAHSAHFSIGSGTKLAMEDAISLSQLVSADSNLPTALESYQQERMTEALRLQNAARNSMEWFENVKRYVRLEPDQFAYSLLTRSQRVSHENLRIRDKNYLQGLERWFAARATAHTNGKAEPATADESTPPMFTRFQLRELSLANRVVVSPMDMYCAHNGTPGDFHFIHLGSRALGGPGLLITEMTCVSPEGRITPGCTGMYANEHVPAWRRITQFVHENSNAKICLQLGHSGPKGSTKIAWEGIDEPLDEDNWEVLAPSPIRHAPFMHLPREMNRADMDKVIAEFARATQMAIDSGFDMLELHCAHGYLLSSFITPLSNKRTDEYGRALANRLRFPLEVFYAMRAIWPADKPISVRISATDWVPGGIEASHAVEVARAFKHAGADIIHVSTGQTSKDANPVYGRMFQTPYSDRIRNEVGIPTIAVGNIVEADQVNGIIAAGRADLCALARPHLSDPHWTLHAAAELGYSGQYWPPQYLTGKEQLERNVKRSQKTKETSARPRMVTTR
jgi:anthraniloyl-CoA monooxygenase